ncbi:MAG TPA: AlkA N-terminal domain-containing protein [bacterium]|nr:AlkA N-terminal domain-containing protein [bacterium]
MDHAAYYRALTARDPRFDGVFFVGVTSTGIYCRPICTAKTPRAQNCRFYSSAEAAESDSFRPCLRCRPELAPGSAPVDDARRIADLLVQRLEEGTPEAGIESIAAQFELSSRQIRRIVQQELGVSPIQLLSTRRLLLAKQLLTETRLPIIEVAFASGFASLRRFNDAFRERYGMPPNRLRREASSPARKTRDRETLTLQLSYRPPFDWPGLLDFLAQRELKGVECISAGEYRRTVRLGSRQGWIRVGHIPERRGLAVELSGSLSPVLPALLGRLRHLFDLSARPDLIAERLSRQAALAQAVARNPGLRVPGAFDGFELALRAVLGQQVTVKAATTLAGRLIEAFGDPIETPYPELNRLSPGPASLAAAKPRDLTKLGIVGARARSLLALAQEAFSGRLVLEAGAPPDQVLPKLLQLPGIGPWTAHYIAMRALRWPDAFPKEDLALRKKLGGATPTQAEALSQAWRPWRSYATLHLWGASK